MCSIIWCKCILIDINYNFYRCYLSKCAHLIKIGTMVPIFLLATELWDIVTIFLILATTKFNFLQLLFLKAKHWVSTGMSRLLVQGLLKVWIVKFVKFQMKFGLNYFTLGIDDIQILKIWHSQRRLWRTRRNRAEKCALSVVRLRRIGKKSKGY